MQSTLRTMWGWASDRDDVPSNIIAGVKKVGGKERSKDRVLQPAELKTLLRALDDEAIDVALAGRNAQDAMYFERGP
jgi:hypothetical protein